MSAQRQVLFWFLAALAALGLLLTVLIWQHQSTRSRWAVFLRGDPHMGGRLFEVKGCARCHAVNGSGARRAPDLGFQRPARSNLTQLVTAMWNHGPQMWARMQLEHMPYPNLSQEEMAHLFAFLYTTRYVEEPGDAGLGQRLFETKGCLRCHALHGAGSRVGPDLAALKGMDTPIVWAQAMWNHAPAMEKAMHGQDLAWPKFEGGEMTDLFAYLREISGGPRRESGLLPADPERGAELFQSKSCLVCHSVNGEGGHVGPELGSTRELPRTLVQFAGLMWNHSPEMWRAAQVRGIPRPTFQGREMADIVAFLASLGYFEPSGSFPMGQMRFTQRGCSRCHGTNAEGTSRGPGLRVRGQVFTLVTFATALWRHGPKMYERTQELRFPWPALHESDVGELLAFLNAPPEGVH